MTSMDRPERPIPGTGTSTTRPPTPAGGPPLASPPPQPMDDRGQDGAGGSVQTGADAGKEVAGHARSEVEEATSHAVEQGQRVAETAKSEVRDIVDEARSVVRTQADRQAEVAAGALSRFVDDLKAMGGEDAPRDSTAQYLQKAASSLDDVVGRLERDGIEGALSGVRSFAQRSPGGFLLASAGAGFALGRILRNGDHPQHIQEHGSASGSSQVPGQQEIDLTSESARFDRQAMEQGASRTGEFAGSSNAVGGMRR